MSRSRIRPQSQGLFHPRKNDALLYAARDYLQEMGWTALVASVDRIQQDRHGQKGNYELVIKFTGAVGGVNPEDAG